MTHIQPPTHLRPSTRDWFLNVVSNYDLEEHHIKLLILAAEAWDRCCDARASIDTNGLTFVDRFDCPRARPEIAIERDSRIGFTRLIRELDLDVEPPPASRRPVPLRSNRGR